MITSNQEAQAAARRAAKRQDKKHPMLVNINDGRLVPNVPRLRTHKDYRVYDGPKGLTDKARAKWANDALRTRTPQVIDSGEPEEPFNVRTASRDDLLLFAADNLGMMLDESKDTETLRKEVFTFTKALEKPPDDDDLT